MADPYLDNFNAGAVARNTTYQDELERTVARLNAMGYQASGNVTPGGSNSAYQLPNTGTLTLNGMQIPYAGANLQGDPVGWAQTQLSNYKAFGPGSEYGSNYFADSNPATGELPSYQGPTPTSAYNPSAPGPAWNPSTNAYQAPPPPNLDPYVQALSRMQQAIPRRFGSAQPDQSSQQIAGPSPLDQQPLRNPYDTSAGRPNPTASTANSLMGSTSQILDLSEIPEIESGEGAQRRMRQEQGLSPTQSPFSGGWDPISQQRQEQYFRDYGGMSPLGQQQPSTGGMTGAYQPGAGQTQQMPSTSFQQRAVKQPRYQGDASQNQAGQSQGAGWYKGGGYSGSTPAAEGRQAAPANPFSASLFPAADGTAAGGTRTRQSTTANRFGVSPVSTTKGFGGI